MCAVECDLHTFDAALADDGLVIVAPFGQHDKPSAKGSSAAVAQILSSQKIGSTAYIRLLVQQRVLIQAFSAASSTSSQSSQRSQRAQAAVLNDRWMYYTRASAVEEAAAGQPSTGPAAVGAGPEVATALRNCMEAGEEVLTLMRHLQQLCQDLAEAGAAAGGGGGSSSGEDDGGADLAGQAADEWERLVHWAQHVERAAGGGLPQSAGPATAGAGGEQGAAQGRGQGLEQGLVQGGGLELRVVVRLSYAAYAAELTPRLLGRAGEEVAGVRAKAMEVTDAGQRLEEAAEYLQGMKDQLGARLALAQLGR